MRKFPASHYLFATVNYNQKRVDKSLALELYGFDTEEEPPRLWTPDKTAVFLCRRLNTDVESPFFRRVKVAARDRDLLFSENDAPSWQVSTATVVEGILKLFSKAPKIDRAFMFGDTSGKRKSREELEDDKSPLRALFRATNDLAIYELIKNYFSAAAELFWKEAVPGNSSIKKTVGIQALFDVLLPLAPEAVMKKTLKKNFFREKLAPASGVNFRDDFFQASGKGRVRIKNTLLLAMGLIGEDKLSDADLASYKRVVR